MQARPTLGRPLGSSARPAHRQAQQPHKRLPQLVVRKVELGQDLHGHGHGCKRGGQAAACPAGSPCPARIHADKARAATAEPRCPLGAVWGQAIRAFGGRQLPTWSPVTVQGTSGVVMAQAQPVLPRKSLMARPWRLLTRRARMGLQGGKSGEVTGTGARCSKATCQGQRASSNSRQTSMRTQQQLTAWAGLPPLTMYAQYR